MLRLLQVPVPSNLTKYWSLFENETLIGADSVAAVFRAGRHAQQRGLALTRISNLMQRLPRRRAAAATIHHFVQLSCKRRPWSVYLDFRDSPDPFNPDSKILQSDLRAEIISQDARAHAHLTGHRTHHFFLTASTLWWYCQLMKIPSWPLRAVTCTPTHTAAAAAHAPHISERAHVSHVQNQRLL